jgi:hypothetical protein
VGKAEVTALSLLRQHWEAVQAVVTALLERRRLTHSLVRALVPDLPRRFVPAAADWEVMLALHPAEVMREHAAAALGSRVRSRGRDPATAVGAPR